MTPAQIMGPAPPKIFLRGLKYEADFSAQAVPAVVKHFGRPQQHGHVAIMPAAVHSARMFGSESEPGLFVQGQAVHVGPEKQHRARPVGDQSRHDSGSGKAGPGSVPCG